MITSRVPLVIAAVCLGFAAWNARVHPTATYGYPGNFNFPATVNKEKCPSVWDRWTDNLPPTEYAPTGGDLSIKLSACSSAIVDREHVSEIWIAGAVIALWATVVSRRKIGLPN